jgi:pectinesterase
VAKYKRIEVLLLQKVFKVRMIEIVRKRLRWLIMVSVIVCCGSPFAADSPVNDGFTVAKAQKEHPGIAVAGVAPSAGVSISRDLVYRDDVGRALHVDVFAPKGDKPAPAVLLVHGGGWMSGSRSHQEPMATYLANRGFVAVTVEYRLSPEARYPAGMSDLYAAVRWMRAKAANYNIDSSAIAILGCSSGAQMATLLGAIKTSPEYAQGGPYQAQSSKVQAIVNIDGIVSFTTPMALKYENDPAKKPSAAEAWFGGRYQQVPELWEQASPLAYVDKHTPPTLFINSSQPRFHAGRDEYVARLDGAGVYSEVHTLPNTPHPFWLFDPWFESTAFWVNAFLQRVLASSDP